MSQSNLQYVDGLINPKKPERDDYADAAFWIAIDRAWDPKMKRTWRDRLAEMVFRKIIVILSRDADARRRFCLVLGPELRRANKWLDQKRTPPAPPKD